jgi:3-phosphoshikimate 1-carboxyvinyltransferase
VPDKSLTHRAVLLGALASGRTRILRPNTGQDCRLTLEAVARLGAVVTAEEGAWIVEGTGGRLREPEDVLDLGNSGTGMRLLMGTVAPQPILCVLTGDASLRRRPMERVAHPLRLMGAQVWTREGGRAPVVLRGGPLRPLTYRLPVASAQVKSALLLAGLGAEAGELRLEEPGPSRDHTERLLHHLGVALQTDGLRLRMRTPARLRGFTMEIPGDPSAAAFFVVAALVTPGSHVVVEDVGLNPRRTGFLRVLQRMGADLTVEPAEAEGPEPRGTLEARSGVLQATEVTAEEVPTLLDEIPVLAVAAAFAAGETRFRGLGELRHKETDRLATTVALLRALGGEAEVAGDELIVRGTGGLAGGRIDPQGDHRIAMSALVAGCATQGEVVVTDRACIETSDPTFVATLERLRSGEQG